MKSGDITAILNSLARQENALTPKQLKKVYALLIASGHYPICPWCKEYIYNINDFTWDHIVPRSKGGSNDLSNLQPMHKECNNVKKENLLYEEEYSYDIFSELNRIGQACRVKSPKSKASDDVNKKEKYNNNKRRSSGRSR